MPAGPNRTARKRLARRVRAGSWDAAEALARLGPAGARALVAALLDRRPDARAAALEGISRLEHPDRAVVDLVVVRLADPDRDVRRQACVALARLRPASGSAGAALAGLLAGDDAAFVVMAAEALGEIGPAAAPAADALADAARRFAPGPSAPRYAAIRALARVGPGRRHVPTLVEALGSEDDSLVAAAVDALFACGPAAADAAPHLRPLLGTGRHDTRIAAAAALVRIGLDGEGPLEALVREAESGPDRLLALVYMRWLGGLAAPALPRLRAMLDDPDHPVREGAAGAIGAIEG